MITLKQVVSLLIEHFSQANPYIELFLDDSLDSDKEANNA
jgi:hypothetical protein